MKKEDVELIKTIAEVMKPGSNSQPAVPVVSVPQDRDSFANLTGGLRQNWPLILALFGFGMWLMNAINDSQTTNLNQQNEIDRNTAAIQELKSLVTDGQTANAEIIRKLDNLQKDVDILNGKN